MESASIWDQAPEQIGPRSLLIIPKVNYQKTKIDMTTANIDALLAVIPVLEKSAQEKIVQDILSKHEIGCHCALCAWAKTRFPTADATDPDRFEEQGGAHETFPFDANNTVHLQSVAKSMISVAASATRSADALESIRDILRGRDEAGVAVKGPLRAIADALIQRVTQSAGPPATQRTPPAQQQLPMGSAQAPASNGKRVATDAELQQMANNLSKFTPKIRFDKPQQWPGESQKGKVILISNGAGALATEVDPTYLDIYADSLDYFAGKAKEKVSAGTATDGDKRDAQFGELEAARCRRIAQRVREGTIQRIVQAPVATSNQTYI
jgi:hypothetical protein